MIIIPIIPTNFDVIHALIGPCVPISSNVSYLVIEPEKPARVISLREMLELRETRTVTPRVRKYFFA